MEIVGFFFSRRKRESGSKYNLGNIQDPWVGIRAIGMKIVALGVT